MLSVFHDAGWIAESHFDEGTVRVRFAIAPTTASIGVVEARESRAESASIARLLAPRSIAVIGAGPARRARSATRCFAISSSTASRARCTRCTPTSVSVAGVRAYASILDVPDAVDLAIVVVPAAEVLDVVAAVRGEGSARASS